MDADTQLAVPDQDGRDDAEESSGPGSRRLSRVVTARAADLDAYNEPAPAAGAANLNLLRLAQEAMRGRYLLAIVLGMITGGLFGALGWRMSRPVYSSDGLVRIANRLPEVMGRTDQNEALGTMLNPFLLSQRTLITSRRVAELAAQQDAWREYRVQPPTDPVGYYADQMTVTVRPNSEYISIAVADGNPTMAAAAATAIINAYQDTYRQDEETTEKRRLGALTQTRDALEGDIKRLNQQIETASQDYGSTQLDGLVEAANQRLTLMQTALADARVALATAQAAARGPTTAPSVSGGAPGEQQQASAQQASAAAAPPAAPELTLEQIAARDVLMRSYLEQEAQVKAELKRLEARGLGEAHPEVKDRNLALEEVRGRIERYAAIVRAVPAAPAPTPPTATAGMTGPAVGNTLAPVRPSSFDADWTRYGATSNMLGAAPVETLRAREQGLLELVNGARQETVELGNARLRLRQLEAELAAKREDLARIVARLETLRSELSSGGRLSVVSTGGVPLAPSKDSRMKLAGLGAVAGAGMPVGLILLASLVWRRYRYSDETEADIAEAAPLLGILPELKRGDSAGERAAAAAHSVHQVRVSLQAQAVGHREDGSRTYLVTSATAGEGKTTLSTSLALSFAAARLRTLVIDADMVGRHLTDAMEAKELEGLVEALAAGTIRGRVRKTAAGLYVMTAGRVTGPDASAVSGASLRALLEECRQHFQVIVIDSGPVLGSLEAATLVREVDGVILAISRGQHRDLVQKAMKRVRTLGGLVVGFVFNRAKPQDFHRSPYGTAVSHRSVAAEVVAAEPGWDAESLTRFGPVVRAVASGFPAA